jgi:NTP pyrophosphatase (non-canonical NTP hydrolase)
MNIIKFDEYQSETKRTSPDEKDVIAALENFSMGLSGESAEVVEIVHDFLFGSPLLDKEKLAKELGDVMWYIARTSGVLGRSLSNVAGISRIDAFQLINANEIFEIERDQLRNLNRLSMKLVATTGVITDHMKKVRFQGREIDLDLVVHQLDRALVLVSQIAYVIEYKLTAVIDMNVKKLRTRYPNGFEIKRSENRIDEE